MTENTKDISLHPRLIVRDVDAALDFYLDALGAVGFERYTDHSGHVVHAAMRVGNSIFSMAQEREAWGLASPDTFNGASVLLYLSVSNPDDVARSMVELGGKVIIQVDDRIYGKREGRVRDPFGHSWILSKTIERLTDQEIQNRLGC